MQVFFFRSLMLLALFFLGAFTAGLTDNNYSAICIWYLAIVAWTLLLGFRKALWIVLPFLLLSDILWDGKLGAVFFMGFFLAMATTYLSARIETRSEILQWLLYSSVVCIFSSCTVVSSVVWPNLDMNPPMFLLIGKIIFWQLLIALIFSIPLFQSIRKIENFLDTSFLDQSKKIR